MRQRAYGERATPLKAADATTLFAAVAYRLRVEEPSGAVSKLVLRRLIVESLTDDDVLGYQRPEARRIADDVLEMAEHEVGLIVSQGAGLVGFLHRVLLDHLAGQHLATWPEPEQASAVQRFVHDPAWRDVLLALLTAQLNPHTAQTLLTAALEAGDVRWADIDGYELLAEALAAGVKLVPRSQARFLDQFIHRVQTHPSLAHRANHATALVGTLAGHIARDRLIPVMKTWLTAPRPDPAPTIWALRQIAIPDDDALERLMWAMRHPEDNVKINAALALAHRFGGQHDLLDPLLAFAHTGPSSATQAAAILALGNGWPGAPETADLN